MKDLDLIVMAATRYALPRRSYIVGAVQNFIRKNIVEDITKQKLAKEIYEWCDGALLEDDHPERETWLSLANELTNKH